MKKLLIAAALASTALAGAAIANPPGQAGRSAGMMRADTDGDGSISRSEYMAQAEARFARMDANGDGQIAGDEMRRPGRQAATGGDAAAPMTKAAYLAKAGERFARMDANGDGKISADEMQAMRDARGARRGPMGGQPDAATPNAPGAATGGLRSDHRAKMLQRIDTDGDGRISRDEMRVRDDKRFAKLDANSDGFIDQGEMEASRDRAKAARGAGASKPDTDQ
ncbi:EF-hand domain-containing protein [Sphingomonas alpina]|uniref:EF-hand domain-containing protein n=1 Tax=Sphingomonas alpina TaxID=653931 RepID=A0A7H0LD52_9SPHN|nr:EF-hand domain-containing protein [Sphingomonas alpina]QNQ07605.1 EF-hand domain-containing protein [Sphingomonas alpina]